MLIWKLTFLSCKDEYIRKKEKKRAHNREQMLNFAI